eukprot:6886555-Prymnesium_polylepis.1
MLDRTARCCVTWPVACCCRWARPSRKSLGTRTRVVRSVLFHFHSHTDVQAPSRMSPSRSGPVLKGLWNADGTGSRGDSTRKWPGLQH